MDAEGRFIRLRHVVRMSRYMPARPEGEPPLLVGVALLVCIASIVPFIAAVVL